MNIIKISSLAFLIITSIAIASDQSNITLPYIVFSEKKDLDAVLDSVMIFDKNGQPITTAKELILFKKLKKEAKTPQEKSDLIKKAGPLETIHQEVLAYSILAPLFGWYECKDVIPVYDSKHKSYTTYRRTQEAIVIGTNDPHICKKIEEYYDSVIELLKKEINNQ